MSIKLKLLALFLIPLIAFFSTAVFNIAQNVTLVNNAEYVTSLVKLVEALNNASDAMQQERSYSNFYQLDSEKWHKELILKRRITDEREAVLINLIKKADISGFSEETQNVIQKKMLSPIRIFKSVRSDVDSLKMKPREIVQKLSAPLFRSAEAGLSLVHEAKTPETQLAIINYSNVVKLKNALGTLHSKLPEALLKGQFPSMNALLSIANMQQKMRDAVSNVMQMTKGQLNVKMTTLHEEVLKKSFYNELNILAKKGIKVPLETELKPWLAHADEILGKISEIEQDAAQVVLTTADAEQNDAQLNFIFWIVLVVIVLSVTLVSSLFLMHRINKPLANMTVRLQDIAEGEADLTKHLENLPKDELGALGNWVNAIIGNLRVLITQIQEKSVSITQSADRSMAVAHANNDAITLQLSEINMVVTAMNEMAVTSLQMAKSASTAANSANEGQTYVDLCNDKVSENCQVIEDMGLHIALACEQVSGLEKNTTQIHGILSTIQNIAEQTNLLALNAAIEAARAGDQGRGFAVVADEVRTLAKRTQDSTSEIANMLDQLQTSTNSVVDAMTQTQEKSSEGLGKAQEAVMALTQVEQAVSMINDMNTQIATATEEQSNVCEEMNRNMTEIQHQSDVVQQQSEQTLANGQALGEIAGAQRELVGKFKT